MSITILKPGVLDTVQDAGRKGYAIFGINPSGVMDILAMKAANALVGNELTTLVIEMHFPAPAIQFNEHALVSTAGADFDAVLKIPGAQETPFANNKTALVNAGTIMSFNKKINGERCYLAVHEGFNLSQWFGSYSTNLKINEGGYKGRRLLKGDTLETGQEPQHADFSRTIFPWIADLQRWYDDPYTFNFLPGPEWDWLDSVSKKYFMNNEFAITVQSDRMGVTLHGLPLQTGDDEQLLSGGVNHGTIQLLPSGQMIILAADHPTTGGYPRIANIISAHLPKLAQAMPGSKIKFLKTSMEHAENLLLVQHKELQQLKQAILFKLEAIK
jgi:antagonist of KipI